MAEETNTTPSAGAQPSRGRLNRLLTEMLTAEQRALYGTLIFFATLMIVGWVMITEPTRLGTFDDQYQARSIQRGAVLYRDNCSACHGLNGEGIAGRGPALNYAGFFNGERSAEIGWTGTTKNFVVLTVNAGRPQMAEGWAQPMPTWGQEYGGPMRPDQVEDVSNYVMNWSLQYEEGGVVIAAPTPAAPACEPVGNDPTAVAFTDLPEGDAERGAALYNNEEVSPINGAPYGCLGCHSIDGSVVLGPSMLGLAERHAGYPEYADVSLEDYIIESILAPQAFTTPGFEAQAAVMPQNFGELMCAQDLADIIAHILSLQEGASAGR